MHPTLVQFRWSHYNEKVRWALDYKGIPHERRSLLPGFHMRQARRLTGRTVLPILILDGRVVDDSTRIIAALEQAFPRPALYPAQPADRERALALEDYFDEELGPHLRRMLMAACLPDMRYLAHLFDAEAGPLTRQLYRGALSLAKTRFARSMKLDPQSVEASRQKAEQALARLEREIQPNGYLVGQGFSVADLTGAALLSVLVRPSEMAHPLSLPLPPGLTALENRFGDRPATAWAREMYRRHRGRWQRIPAGAKATHTSSSSEGLRLRMP